MSAGKPLSELEAEGDRGANPKLDCCCCVLLAPDDVAVAGTTGSPSLVFSARYSTKSEQPGSATRGSTSSFWREIRISAQSATFGLVAANPLPSLDGSSGALRQDGGTVLLLLHYTQD